MIARKKSTALALVFLLSLINRSTYPYTIVPGNSENTSSTFTFPVAQWIARQDGRIFVSAGAEGAGAYAISYFDLNSNSFTSVAFQEVTLNGTTAENPLFDKKISLLGLVEQDAGGLVAVLDDTTSNVYFIEAARPNILLSKEGITDANGEITSGIVSIEGSNRGRAFLAVKPAQGVFGDPNSGINVIGLVPVKVAIDNTETTVIQLGTGREAIQFDKTSSFLGINAPLSTLEAPVPMTWSRDLEFLYIGAHTIVANTVGNGARSVALGITGQVDRNSLTIRTIFDVNTDFTGLTNNTIIAAGPDEQLSIHHINSLSTSTNKNYLIVVGGNGSPEETQTSAYAIPLVPSGNVRGVVANKDNTNEPALTVAQMVTQDDIQARIGGGHLPAGTISSLTVRAETVFVTVAQGAFGGVYYSQPLFDANGDIKAWTSWARATEITQSAFVSSLEFTGDTSFILTSDDPQGENIPNTVVHATWGEGDENSFAPAVSFLNTYFPSNDTLIVGGIQRAYNFADTIAGLDSITVLAALGKDRCALVQTGIRESGVILPTPATAFIPLENDSGAIQTTPTNQTILAIQGGALTSVGPLTTIAFAHSNELNDTWLCVAGSHGLAILQHEDGSGCGSALGPNFSGITQGMTFQKFGNYSFVQKIVADNNSLYVLTDTRLDRIVLAADIQESTIQTIAQIPLDAELSSYNVFMDCIISNSLGLIATSSKLLRTADGSRITDDVPAWQSLDIPEGQIPVMALYTTTTTNNDADCARGAGANLYVLTGNAYSNLSLINRFSIAGLEEGAPVTADTVLPFATDKFAPYQVLSYFIDYGETKNAYATDGASTFAVHNRHGATPTTVVIPTVGALAAFPKSGNRFIGVKSHEIHTTVPKVATIESLLRNSASGAWLLAGTMGLRVLE